MLRDEEILQKAGLSFDVKQAPVKYEVIDKKGNTVLRSDDQRFVNYRSDTGERLGIVSDQYEIVQFRDSVIPVYRQLESFSKDFNISTQYAGGKFYTRFLINTDVIVPYSKNNEKAKVVFDCINSFDGSRRFTSMLNILRLVCTNLMYAMSPAISLGGIHMKGNLDMKDLGKVGAEIENYKKSYLNYYSKLRDVIVSNRDIDQIEHELGPENMMLTEAKKNYKMHKGTTAWELYNEFTFLNSKKKIQPGTKQKKDMMLISLFNKVFAL